MRRRMLASLSGGWKNPYVTDGLVAMWDGEWNAGGGVHDPNATVWKDLVGDADATSSSPFVFSENSAVKVGSQTMTANLSNEIPFDSDMTVEVVINIGSGGNSGVFSTGGIKATIKSDSRLYFYFSGDSQNYITLGVNAIRSCSLVKIGSERIDAYLNAVLFARSSSGNPSTTSSIILGAGRVAVNQTNYHSFRIYNRALTTAEIAANRAIDKARFNIT